MKKIITFFYIAGMIFWMFFLLKPCVKYYIFNMTELKSIPADSFDIRESSDDFIISYTFMVEKNTYSEKIEVAKEYFNNHFTSQPNALKIVYSPRFPNLNFIDGLHLEQRKIKIEFIISSFFIVFLTVLFIFWNKKYNAKISNINPAT